MAQKLKTVDEILESLDLVVEKHTKDESGISVLVVDKNSDFKAWIDVDIYPLVSGGKGYLRHDWNQYIFYLLNADDVRQQELQDNADLYMAYTDKAVEYLESIGEIGRDEEDNWKFLK